MNATHDQLAKNLAVYLASKENVSLSESSRQKIQIVKPNQDIAMLDLTPFIATPQTADAMEYFAGVGNIGELEQAYFGIKGRYTFEEHLPEAMSQVSDYAGQFITMLFDDAKRHPERRITDTQARLIAGFAQNLDAYTAVKSVESLLYSKADLKLLEIAADYHWQVHYDHMAIRCGTQVRKDAERIADLLITEHGYVVSQVPGEDFYQFPEGWNAFPVYKILNNGQILRVFIDQSDGSSAKQIIQHWNRVYGYTAHHLGISVTKYKDGKKVAVPLTEVIEALGQQGVQAMEPTGMYTEGLLQQVFTKPEKNAAIPQALKMEIAGIDPALAATIENAKLLEIVSRKEMPLDLAKEFFGLYGLQFDDHNPLHSAPCYQYFLPAQAAHVIKTSTQIERRA